MSKKILCPLLKKPCIEHECAWFANIQGNNPQTGAVMDHWDCSVKWIPIMVLEGARHTRGVQAATENMRNEVIQRQDKLNHIFESAAMAAGHQLPNVDTAKQIEG